VLSGFLITNILINSKEASNYFSVFYARRFLRIFPIYYMLLCCVIIVALCRHMDISSGWYYFFYIQNFVLAKHSFNLTTFPNWFDHTWTLAIEEQFYIFFPLLVKLLRQRGLTIICIIIILITWLNRYVFYSHFHWGNTFSSFDCLAAGALVAIGLKHYKANTMIWILFSVFVMLSVGCLFSKGPLQPFLATALVPFICVTVLVLVTKTHKIITVLFENRLIVYLGKISYGIYLYHYPIIFITDWLAIRYVDTLLFNPYLLIAIKFVVIIGVSAISFKWFESRILLLKDKFTYKFIR
jgi:peptidoglycan/LPS O-acetylase OafA/YrhL